MDIFELIKADHRKVEEIFAEIEKAKSSKTLDKYFHQLYQELNLHARVEELTFYPTMRNHEGTEKFLEEAEEEHTEVKVMLEQMKSMDASSDEFKEKLSQLKKAVLHHVQEEENEIFSKVNQCMSEDELQLLVTEFQETKSKLQEQMSVASR